MMIKKLNKVPYIVLEREEEEEEEEEAAGV
jgi:hypothetical protein